MGLIELKTEPDKFYTITEQVRKIVKESEVKNGICLVFCAGSTGSIIINEDEPMLLEDIRKALERIAPKSKIYHHPDNAYSHIRATVLGSEKLIPVRDGDLTLGTWQDIIFYEGDTSPRSRKIIVTVL